MKTVNINKISAIFLGVVLLSSVLSSAAYAGGLPITDLSIKKTSNQATAAPGELWDFSVAVTNNSQDPAEFAEIVDPLDSNLEFVMASPDICSLATSINTLFCFVPTLLTGEEFVVDITTRVKSTTPLDIQIPNKASVFGDSSASTPDDEDEIFLLVGANCVCDKLSIKPEIAKKGIKDVRILSEVIDMGTKLKVVFRIPWTASILCSGGAGTCEGTLLLTRVDVDWISNITPTTSKSANSNTLGLLGHVEVVDRKINIKAGKDGLINTIQCEGKEKKQTCVSLEKRVVTQFTSIISLPNNADTNMDLPGKVTLTIEAAPNTKCATTDGWEKMIIKIKTSLDKNNRGNKKQFVVDVPTSDYDGDGKTNAGEGGKDGKIGTKDDPRNNQGLPNWLNPKIK